MKGNNADAVLEMGEAMSCFTYVDSPVGRLTLASNDAGNALTGLWIEGQKFHGIVEQRNFVSLEELPLFQKTANWLKRYFRREAPLPSEIPLAGEGTSFQKQVWELLAQIPYGALRSYGALARQMEAILGHRIAPQAVGSAVGHNPIAILIPCHRVVGKNGELTGYAAGMEVKRFLLHLESAFLVG